MILITLILLRAENEIAYIPSETLVQAMVQTLSTDYILCVSHQEHYTNDNASKPVVPDELPQCKSTTKAYIIHRPSFYPSVYSPLYSSIHPPTHLYIYLASFYTIYLNTHLTKSACIPHPNADHRIFPPSQPQRHQRVYRYAIVFT